MHPAGTAVILVTLALFALSIVMLFRVYGSYRRIASLVSDGREKENSFLRYVVGEYSAAYKQYGQSVNTPAIIDSCLNAKHSALFFCERFLNNAVSLFVTLGLFGTFLGLSFSVSSLTELIGFSNTSEWLSVLDSVGEGLMSALSGMGVAFYTSLVGVACSILLTFLRTIFCPQAARESLANIMELWLDHTIATTLQTDAVKNEVDLAANMIKTMNEAADGMKKTMRDTTEELSGALENSKKLLVAFNSSVKTFNEGVRDFSEVDYNLRGTVERMDVSVRDLVGMIRQTTRVFERKDSQ